jgi:hypothetical protein
MGSDEEDETMIDQKPFFKVLRLSDEDAAECMISVSEIFRDNVSYKDAVKIFEDKYSGKELIFTVYTWAFYSGTMFGLFSPQAAENALRHVAECGKLAEANREFAIKDLIRFTGRFNLKRGRRGVTLYDDQS